MFEFNKVNKSFKNDFWAQPVQVLKDLSFEVEKNKIVGFLGANGAGKTTSLKILLNFIKHDSGSIHFQNEMGSSFVDIRKQVGYLPERPYFYNYLTGREFISYMGKLSDVTSDKLKSRTRSWSERLKIDHALDRQVRSYSKGMLQRLGFISAVIHDPKLLILDEPLSGLDPVGRKEFKDSLLLLKNEGKTIFFSSHIISDVEEVCEKVVVIDKGQLKFQGPIDTIIEENIEQKYSIKITGSYTEVMSIKSSFIKEDSDQLKYSYFLIPNNKKDDFLKDMINSNIQVLHLEQVRPSLEEVVYKIETSNG
ncbi:MAG: ABC transporter ATP-binding protein [Bdellovibrionales bacterium]|nr:ABC transporter ATP-binding protein [Bdellovibrionales bacterium]